MNNIPNDRLFVQVTYGDLSNKLWLIRLFRVNCEIYISPRQIDLFDEPSLRRIKAALDKNSILKRIHAPIYNTPEEGHAIFKESYLKTARFCKALGVRSVVMHVESLKDDIDIWRWLADSARRDDLTILLENHSEKEAAPIVSILEQVRCENLKACYDIGHFNAFGIKGAILSLADYPDGSIGEVHLSDNLGDSDTHLALGKGNIDFLKFFEAVERKGINCVYTIEAKDVWGVIGGIRYLRKIGL